MSYELKKYLVNNMNRYKNSSDETKNEVIEVGDMGYLAELYYAEKRNTSLMTNNFPGYDLADKTEIKSATTNFTNTGSVITINGLGTKDLADLIIIIYNDLVNKVIAEVTVTPDDIKKVDGTMPTKININKSAFRKQFANKTKILATY
tara:strand:+ start:42 stop:485 length:444 start_codon:yes stop_codon:yes gene_type:complete